MKNFEIYTNKRKNVNVIYRGIVYNKDDRKKEANAWRCSNRACKGKGFIANDIFELLIAHDKAHLESDCLVEKIKVISKINEVTKTTNHPNQKIITDATCMLEPSTLATIPKYKSLNDKITRIKNELYYKNKIDDIPEFLKLDLRKNKFLQFDSGNTDIGRFIIFFQPKHPNFLKILKQFL